jgi:hypothetical protein
MPATSADVLMRADNLLADGRLLEAIDALRDANRDAADAAVERKPSQVRRAVRLPGAGLGVRAVARPGR